MGRRIAIGIAGVTVVLVGLALLVLPGPGIVVILAGLGLLSIEFAFARRWFAYLQARSQKVADNAGIPKRWRWAFPALALAITVVALAVPLFVCIVRTPSGMRIVRKPSITYARSITDTETLLRAAAGGDRDAAALLDAVDAADAADATAAENR